MEKQSTNDRTKKGTGGDSNITIGIIQARFNQELDIDEEEEDFLEDMIEKNPPRRDPVFEVEAMIYKIKYDLLEEKAA